jgi:site-specific recombinase XerD
VVLRYRSHLESRQLAPGTINLRLGAVRRLAYEAADCGLLSADLAAGIRRVKGVKKLGVRLGNWLTAEQAQSLWRAPDCQRLKGKRDRALKGKVFRRVNKVGKTWGDMTEKSVWHIVKEAAKSISVAKVSPHDLRRTCARLCHTSGGELEQIQFLLGHVSIQTTERYLGCKQRI